MDIRIIDDRSKADINIKNEPFSLFGRMIPSYCDEKWGYDVKLFPKEEISEMCFPDENYDYDAMSKDCVFIGAYNGEKCIGLAVLQDYMFKYMYLYDLKVLSNYRNVGIASALIEKAKEVALSKRYCGIYTIGQDNNLAACRFYLKAGFQIGGFDNRVYKGTSQDGKADIIFYLDC